MDDVVISYAREDQRMVGQLALAMERSGLRVWWDQNLQPGDDFEDVIRRRINGAPVTVVVWSNASRTTHWVRGEAQIAQDAGTYFPVLLNNVELPIPFGSTHAMSLAAWTGESDHPIIHELVQKVRQRAGTHRASPHDKVFGRERKARPLAVPTVGRLGAVVLFLALIGAVTILRVLRGPNESKSGPAQVLVLPSSTRAADRASDDNAAVPTITVEVVALVPTVLAVDDACRVLRSESACPDQIVQLETLLDRAGLRINVNEKFGGQTRQALHAFQHIEGLPPSGEMEYRGTEWGRLVEVAEAGGYLSITLPHGGPEDIEDLQVRLQALAYLPDAPGVVDGLFGPNTTDSLVAWQSANGFEADGTILVNSDEWHVLADQARAVAATTTPVTSIP